MPMYEYECKAKHAHTRVVIKPVADEPKEEVKCPMCTRKAKLVPSHTGKPILKRGCGGFYKPSR